MLTAALGPGAHPPLTEINIRNGKIIFLRSRVLPVRRADNITAIYEITV
jgi:hypothetical protein